MDNDLNIDLKRDIAIYNLSKLDYMLNLGRNGLNTIELRANIPNNRRHEYKEDMSYIGFSGDSGVDNQHYANETFTILISGTDDVELAINSGILPDNLEALCVRAINSINNSSELASEFSCS